MNNFAPTLMLHPAPSPPPGWRASLATLHPVSLLSKTSECTLFVRHTSADVDRCVDIRSIQLFSPNPWFWLSFDWFTEYNSYFGGSKRGFRHLWTWLSIFWVHVLRGKRIMGFKSRVNRAEWPNIDRKNRVFTSPPITAAQLGRSRSNSGRQL